jgi:hypothetical protein
MIDPAKVCVRCCSGTGTVQAALLSFWESRETFGMMTGCALVINIQTWRIFRSVESGASSCHGLARKTR